MKRTLFVTTVVAIILAVFALTGLRCPDGVSIQENFVLAYVTTQNTVNVRYANVSARTVWNDGQFPGSIRADKGVGLATDTAGLLHIAFFEDQSAVSVRMVWGLGPAVWDNSASSTAASPPVSSPVAAPLGGNRWVIAYHQSGGTVFAGVYDHESRRILANVAPLGALNSQAEGRPSISASRGTVVITWRRWEGNVYDLIVSKGSVQQGNLVFSTPQIIPTPMDASVKAGVQSDPVVTHSAGNFYLMAVREERSTGQLHGWRAQLFHSADGAAWVSTSLTSSLDVHNQTYLGLAGTSDGTLLAASIRPLSAGGASKSAAEFINGQWQAFSSTEVNAMFDVPIGWKPFMLVGNRQP